MNSALLVEFLGTALLLSAIAFGKNPLMIIAALATAITIGSSVSGAHFNPAVTLFELLKGKISQSKAAMYVLVQLAAALSVSFLGRSL
jgi:glycerol uptake facilitator-like aquaporin